MNTTNGQREQRVCTIPGCDRPHHAKGLCMTHYRRLRRTGSPNSGVALGEQYAGREIERWCSAPGCDRPSRALGYCMTHYRQVWGRGYAAPEPIRPRRTTG